VGAVAEVSPPGGLARATGINPTNLTARSLGSSPSKLIELMRLPLLPQKTPVDWNNKGDAEPQKI
jgi:hypothetical protein